MILLIKSPVRVCDCGLRQRLPLRGEALDPFIHKGSHRRKKSKEAASHCLAEQTLPVET